MLMTESLTPEEWAKPLHDAQDLAREFRASSQRAHGFIEHPQSNVAQLEDKTGRKLESFKKDPATKHFFEPTDAAVEGSPTRIEAAFPGLIEKFLGDDIWDRLSEEQPADTDRAWFVKDEHGQIHIQPEGYIKLYARMSEKLGNKNVDESRSVAWNEFGAAAIAMGLNVPADPKSQPVEFFNILGAIEVMVNEKATTYLEKLKSKAKLIKAAKVSRVVSTGTDNQEMRTGWDFDGKGKIELDTTFSLLHGVKSTEMPFGADNTKMTFRQILGELQLAVNEGHDAVKDTIDALTDAAVITPETQTRFTNHLKKAIAQEADPARKARLEAIAATFKSEPIVHTQAIIDLSTQLRSMSVKEITDAKQRKEILKQRADLIEKVGIAQGLSVEEVKTQLGQIAANAKERVVFDPEATRDAMRSYFDLTEISQNINAAIDPKLSEKEKDVQRTLINRYFMDWGQIIYGTEGHAQKRKNRGANELHGGDLTNPPEIRMLTSEVATDLRAAEVLMDQLIPAKEKYAVIKLRAQLAEVYARRLTEDEDKHITEYLRTNRARAHDESVVVPYLSETEAKWIDDVARAQKALLDKRAFLESAMLAAHGVRISGERKQFAGDPELIAAIQKKRDAMTNVAMDHAMEKDEVISQIDADTSLTDNQKEMMKKIIETDSEHEKRRLTKLKNLYGTHLTKMLLVGQAYDMGLKGIEYRYRQKEHEVKEQDALVEQPLPDLKMPRTVPQWRQMGQADIRVNESDKIKTPAPIAEESPRRSLRDRLGGGTPDAQAEVNIGALGEEEQKLITKKASEIIQVDGHEDTESTGSDELTKTTALLQATWRHYLDPQASFGEKLGMMRQDQAKLVKRMDELVDEVAEVPVLGAWLKSLTTLVRGTSVLGTGRDGETKLSPAKRAEKFTQLILESLVSQATAVGDILGEGMATPIRQTVTELTKVIDEIKVGDADSQKVLEVLLPKALDLAISRVKDPRTKFILTVMKRFAASTKTGNQSELKSAVAELLKKAKPTTESKT